MSEISVILENIKELNEIDEKIERNIKLLYVFDSNVILVTNEDTVFCFGDNSYGVLGFGHQNPVEQFTINEDLSNKQIIDFKSNLFHTIALNTDGKLYCWGNKLCSSNGVRNHKIYKPTLNMINEKIIDFCCGGWHILVLTVNNEVYAWGGNDFGQTGNEIIGKDVPIPLKVNGLNGKRVKAISCGSYHSMALTENGCVYSWGNNEWGQLGMKGGYKESKVKCILIGVKIEKIMCGPEHSLLLSYEGDIYVFGNNEFGQLGLPIDKEKHLTPIKLNLSEKFIEIASDYRYDISVALSKNGLYFVWGECGAEGIISKPREAKFRSLNEVFMTYCKNTYKSVGFAHHNINAITQSESLSTSYINQEETFILKNGHIETVKFLKEKGAKVEDIDDLSKTPLHVAASGGHLEIVKFLIEKGAKMENIEDSIKAEAPDLRDIDDENSLGATNSNNSGGANNMLIDVRDIDVENSLVATISKNSGGANNMLVDGSNINIRNSGDGSGSNNFGSANNLVIKGKNINFGDSVEASVVKNFSSANNLVYKGKNLNVKDYESGSNIKNSSGANNILIKGSDINIRRNTCVLNKSILKIVMKSFHGRYHDKYQTSIVKGNFDIVLFVYIIIILLLIVFYVFYNNGHIKASNNMYSTLGLSIKEGLNTNYSADDFDTRYVKPEEFQNYNRVWDFVDFVFKFSTEIQVMTNMAITANQSMSECPEDPNIIGTLCHSNSDCKKGLGRPNGFQTGRCVRSDFPYRHSNWTYVDVCEIRGWCPVNRLLTPLKNKFPVLIDTKNNTLWIKNTIVFPEHGITLDNQFNNEISNFFNCRYNPETDPYCPVFILGDIIKYTPNAEQSYEEMAKRGATIVINIEWDCFLNEFSNCKPTYSFRRIDDEDHRAVTRYMSYKYAFYYKNGKNRTFVLSYRIRFVVSVTAVMSQYDWFHFITNICAYAGPFFIFLFIFKMIMSRNY